MTPVFQTKFGAEEGNCLTACVATLLDRPIESLPEFCVGEGWLEVLETFCAAEGHWLSVVEHAAPVPHNKPLIAVVRAADPYFLHAVVVQHCDNGVILALHDPNPMMPRYLTLPPNWCPVVRWVVIVPRAEVEDAAAMAAAMAEGVS